VVEEPPFAVNRVTVALNTSCVRPDVLLFVLSLRLFLLEDAIELAPLLLSLLLLVLSMVLRF
jgi:hypothetical protein